MKKIKNLSIPINVSLSIEQLVQSIVMDSAAYETVPNMVAAIDLACADWDITERLIAHFKAIELELQKEDPDGFPVTPKKIT